MTARGNIDFGLRSARPSLSKTEHADITRTYLEQVGLTDAAERRPARLSGGMQQRVGIARAFAIDPPIMLLDEPFDALDALTRRELQLQLLNIWEASRRTVVMVTHDVDEAIYMGTRVIVMEPSPGRIKADIPIKLDYPRNRSSAQFIEYRNQILEMLNYGVKE